MAMHNPPHPGEFIVAVYLEPNGIAGRELASKLGCISVDLESRSHRQEWGESENGSATLQVPGALAGELAGHAARPRSVAGSKEHRSQRRGTTQVECSLTFV